MIGKINSLKATNLSPTNNYRRNTKFRQTSFTGIVPLAKPLLAFATALVGSYVVLKNTPAKKILTTFKSRKPEPSLPSDGMEPMLARVCELSGVKELLPELAELNTKINNYLGIAKKKTKSIEEFNKAKHHMNLDYYISSFRRGVTMSADRLKALRNSDQTKFADVFEKSRLYFQTEDGLLIYGKNTNEKKKLIEYFINEARAHEIDVEYISTKGLTGDNEISEILNDTFINAKKKFNEQKRHTLIVIEDVDYILKKDGPPIRAIWNRISHKSGQDGVITLTTARDIKDLDDSCVRAGRIRYWIDIDDAIAKQAEIDALKL